MVRGEVSRQDETSPVQVPHVSYLPLLSNKTIKLMLNAKKMFKKLIGRKNRQFAIMVL